MNPWRAISLLTLSVFALEASARDWSEYTSDHFTVHSDADSDDVAALIQEFELFRLVTLSVLGLPDGAEDDRLLIFVFGRGREYGRFRPSSNVAGYFYHSIFGPRMIVASGNEDEIRYLLFHEYVHYLVHRRSRFNYPRWYSEGLASLLESAEISDSGIRVGLPPIGFARAIELGFNTTVDDLIDLKPGGSESSFYLMSWLLTHYLLLDSSADASRKQHLADYLRRYDAGEDPVEAFEAAFGMTASEMYRELGRYARRPTLSGLSWPANRYEGRLSRPNISTSSKRSAPTRRFARRPALERPLR